MTDMLKGNIAVVIGGSGGIGAATARMFAGEGARVVVTYRNRKDAAEAVIAGLAGEGHLCLPADLADTPSLDALAAAVAGRMGGADILVNTGGFTQAVPAADLDALTDDLIDSIFAVNWRGQFAAIRAFRQQLAARGDGLIVNVSSIAAFNGVGSNIAYAAVKAATDTMTKALARALAPAIRVMGVSPGVVDTDFVPGRGPEQLARIAPTVPLRRVATPDDVARAILACATHLTYSTGSLVVVDGGRAL